jgi:hypothetical protein
MESKIHTTHGRTTLGEESGSNRERYLKKYNIFKKKTSMVSRDSKLQSQQIIG